ncbi:MAG: hypothetical protein ACTHXA_08215 [Gulosibacter sp.]|uniref:hypothetical protein n=1 Tax=Gulosibacter sp. TaxID=2817531 RepID=UPI003F8EABC5
MSWWSWVLIWTGLVVLLIAVLVIGALWLWRKLTALMPEIDRLQLLNEELGRLAEEAAVPYEPRRSAILRPSREVFDERDAFVEARDARREERRERKLEHANTLIHADPMQYAYLVEHPRKGQ